MYYIINRETEKLELHFSKEEYQALPEADKAKIKSNFLFSKRGSCWVSRAKRPNLYYAEKTAKELGAEDRGKTGELLTFEEKMARQAERAAERADRMEARSENARERAQALQAPINAMHGDIAFFTQPNINTSSGRAFTRQRERMFAAFDRGFEEFKKSEYYAERAEIARRTANQKNAGDKAFCDRRVKDAEKAIKKLRENLEHYHVMLECDAMEETQTRWDGTKIERSEIENWIDDTEDRLESEISKLCYYQSCIDALGGVQFSKENIKPGYVVKIKHYNDCTVLRTGPKNFTYRTPNGFDLTAAYAEILEIVKAEEAKKPVQPFKPGEIFTVRRLLAGAWTPEQWEIVKATATTVTLKNQTTGEIIRRTPKIRSTCGGDKWVLSLDDYSETVYRNIGE